MSSEAAMTARIVKNIDHSQLLASSYGEKVASSSNVSAAPVHAMQQNIANHFIAPVHFQYAELGDQTYLEKVVETVSRYSGYAGLFAAVCTIVFAALSLA
jgi:hypothetical protein